MALSVLEGPRATLPSCSVIDLFESHAHSIGIRHTAAIIDASTNISISYAQLNSLSNAVANKLVSFIQSVGFDSRTGRTEAEQQPLIVVYFRPSIERVILLLAIWKINGTFLPLDASMPTARMRVILQQAKATVVISSDQETHFEELKTICAELECLYLDYYMYLDSTAYRNDSFTQRPQCFAQWVSNPFLSIYFTSGSTGEPKGVRMRTDNWINLVTSYWREFPFRKGQLACHMTSIGFVESLNEILVCVLGGIPLLILSRDCAVNPEILLQTISKYNVTHLSLVPSMVRAIIKVRESVAVLEQNLNCVRVFLCTSETLEPSLAKQIRSVLHQDCVLVNMYGSTEDTCDVTAETFWSTREIDEKTFKGSLSVGSPILNTTVAILDNNNRLVEPGVQGHIYVGGTSVAYGYIGRDDGGSFTQMACLRFFGRRRVFKTGDRGYIHKGMLFFVGRSDNMVKIRGHRVSCTEIEHRIQETNVVDKVVVMPVQDEDAIDKVKLVAFCSRKSTIRRDQSCGSLDNGRRYLVRSKSVDSESVAINEVKVLNDTAVASTVDAHCRLSLPGYMIPKVVVLAEFPLKPLSGKIDKDELIKCVKKQSSPTNSDQTGSGREEDILRIIAHQVQMTSNQLQKDMSYTFLELGGNSLSAVNAVVALRAKNFDISVENFISAPISDILRIEQRRRHGSSPSPRPAMRKITADSDHEKLFQSRFVIKPLREFRNHEGVKRLMALSFTQKNPLDLLMGTSLRDFMIFLNSIWRPIVEDNMSFVVVDRENRGEIVGASLNVDTRTELQPEIMMEEVIAINEAVEAPVKVKLKRAGGRWMDAMLNAVEMSLPNNLTLPILIMMEEFVIELAQRFDLDGIVTVNSHQVTMALAEQTFGYKVENVLHVKSFQYGGRRPFISADDNYTIKCMTKRLK